MYGLVNELYKLIKKKDFNDLYVAIQDAIPEPVISFKSVDIVMDQDEVVDYPTEFLNSL